MPSRCGSCQGFRTHVLGDGPTPCRILCLGEAPGQIEDKYGRPFIGPTGQEFDQTYLPLAGLERGGVYVTNTRHCRPDNNRKPTDKEAWDCARHHLPSELEATGAEVVLLMGGTACSLVPDVDLEVEHGIPRRGRLFDWEGWVVPMFHPALGLHDTSKMTLMLEDWEGLRSWVESNFKTGPWWSKGWIDGEDGRDYALSSGREILDYAFADSPMFTDRMIGVDTETHDGKPWSVQISVRVGSARMVRLDDAEAVRALGQVLKNWAECCGDFVFHNAMADLGIVEEVLGVRGFKWRDTMQEAWHLGNLPQGLKALSYRLLGRRRPSWEEVVAPWSREVLGDWIMRAVEYAEREWTERRERVSEKTGKPLKTLVVPSETEKVLRSVFGHAVMNPAYDVWERLHERVGEGQLARLAVGLGVEVPRKGIAHVPLDEAVRYGCDDASDTLALAMRLEELRGELVKVWEGDVDGSESDLGVRVEGADVGRGGVAGVDGC